MEQAEKWVIKYPRTNRYYIDDTWDRMEEDFRPEWGESGDTSRAMRFPSKESAESYMKTYAYAMLGCVVEKIE